MNVEEVQESRLEEKSGARLGDISICCAVFACRGRRAKMVVGVSKLGEWPGHVDEYEKLVFLMNTPRVVIDNDVFPTETLVTVESPRKHRSLLETVKLLSDLNLSINKAYFSSDGEWFIDVFHVKDQFGCKLTDVNVISFIEENLEAGISSKVDGQMAVTGLELSGPDRPGLLSEIFAVLSDLHCIVVDARVWTHNDRVAAILYISDENSRYPIDNKPHRMRCVLSRLCHVLRGRAEFSSITIGEADRRLHQMMLADRDFEVASYPPAVNVQSMVERGYSVVSVHCVDRPKLLFDIACTLNDMEYVVFHGTVRTDSRRAYQEFYIRHSDGRPISSEAERQRVKQCLQAAIERRAHGLRLEICAVERHELLSEVTRLFREYGLLVKRAEISSMEQYTSNVFYVTNSGGCMPISEAVTAIQQRFGTGCLIMKEEPAWQSRDEAEVRTSSGLGLLYLRNLLLRNLHHLGLIRSC